MGTNTKRSRNKDEKHGTVRYRTLDEIVAAAKECSDKLWYDRHQMLVMEAWERQVCPDCAGLAAGEKVARRMEDEYGDDELGPYEDFELDMLRGKLLALRWVLGDEWDMLDS